MGIIRELLSKLNRGPAIQNLENFDMILQMKDGGVLLPIVCSRHLDHSDENIFLVNTKIKNYLLMLKLEEFQSDFPSPTYIQIELDCVKRPDQIILDELDTISKSLDNIGIRITWRS